MVDSQVVPYTTKQEDYATILTKRLFSGRMRPEDVLLFQDLASNPNALSGLAMTNLVDSMSVIEKLYADGKIAPDVYSRARLGLSTNLINMTRVSSMNQKDRVVEAKLTADSINRLMRGRRGESVGAVLTDIHLNRGGDAL